MEIEMKKQILMSLLIIAALIGLNSAVQAQSQSKWSGNVPFEFIAGGKTFAAGEYSIKIVNPASDRPALVIQSMQTRESVIVQSMTETAHSGDEATFQFRRYGNRYFFGGVKLAGDSLALRIGKSKHERALQTEFARNGESASMVAVKSK
jgi:hypothetical protein